jgi:hypothetical protein
MMLASANRRLVVVLATAASLLGFASTGFVVRALVGDGEKNRFGELGIQLGGEEIVFPEIGDGEVADGNGLDQCEEALCDEESELPLVSDAPTNLVDIGRTGPTMIASAGQDAVTSIDSSESIYDSSEPIYGSDETVRARVLDNGLLASAFAEELPPVAHLEMVGSAANGDDRLEQASGDHSEVVLRDHRFGLEDGLDRFEPPRRADPDVHVVGTAGVVGCSAAVPAVSADCTGFEPRVASIPDLVGCVHNLAQIGLDPASTAPEPDRSMPLPATHAHAEWPP